MSKKIYLAVSFEEKDIAKGLGAKWDAKEKMWFVYEHDNNDYVVNRWKLNTDPINLVGEDREFGGNELFVDLIPATCWFSNVRSCIHPSDWDRVRRHIYERANNICECCGIDATRGDVRLEAHERWHYDEQTKTQKLMRVIALCEKCHQSTHMGLSGIRGIGEQAKQHLKNVRHFDDEQLKNHIHEAFEIWEQRNAFKWELDISLITNNGIKLADNADPTKKNKKEQAIKELAKISE